MRLVVLAGEPRIDLRRLRPAPPAVRARRDRLVQIDQPAQHFAHLREVVEQIVELDDQRQEVAARQRLAALEIVERFFERVRALFDRLEAERRGFALDRVHLAIDAVDLGAERRLFARRLLQDRVHHLQRHVGVGEEAGEAVRLDVQDAQQQIELRLRLFLRFLQLARQHHALGDVVDRHQQVRQRAFRFHAVEVELEEVRVEAAGRIVEVHFDFVQRVDGLDQLLVDALAPQQRDVVHRGAQRLLRHDLLQQRVEREVGEIFAAEDGVERHRALAAELQVLVEQEQTFVHRAQNVRRFPCARGSRPLLPCAGCARSRRRSRRAAAARRPCRRPGCRAACRPGCWLSVSTCVASSISDARQLRRATSAPYSLRSCRAACRRRPRGLSCTPAAVLRARRSCRRPARRVGCVRYGEPEKRSTGSSLAL